MFGSVFYLDMEISGIVYENLRFYLFFFYNKSRSETAALVWMVCNHYKRVWLNSDPVWKNKQIRILFCVLINATYVVDYGFVCSDLKSLLNLPELIRNVTGPMQCLSFFFCHFLCEVFIKTIFLDWCGSLLKKDYVVATLA